ncbi:MAG: type II secretion system protein [bacterium]
MFNNFNKIKTKLVKGFTLVEMMVVVAIIIVTTSVLLFKQSKFSSDILVTNAAYEVALAIRQAQVYGISSKQVTATAGGISNVGYGIYLDNSLINEQQSAFRIYSDSGDGSNPVNYPFVWGGSNEYAEVDRPHLTQGQKILRFCVVGGNGTLCSSNTSSIITSLNIGFIKPKPEAVIHDSNSGTDNTAIIVVASALGDKCRVVRITAIGQISVDTPRPVADECTNVSF